MKLIALLLLLLTFSNTEQACAAGCLKCDATSNCIVPDISQSYVLSNNTAVKTTLTNCLILNPDGTCSQCNANYFVDATTAKCVAVPTASLITNCNYYNTATSCRLCAAGFYLNNNACTAVTTTIANCAAYASATTCNACNTGYILSLDLTSCVSISSTANCSGYTYVTCGACTTGYHLNRNSAISANLAVDTAANTANLTNFARNVITTNNFVGINACASNGSLNCTTFAVDSDVCTLCNAGYFLDTTGACNAFPNEPIGNCAIYTNATTCYSCAAGYTLNSNVCTAIASGSLISNCATYDTRASTVTCLTCSAAFYLNSNACAARVNSLNVTNCATYATALDQCATCATGNTLTTDGAQCLTNIANCAVHIAPAKNGTLQCQTCASTYYLVAATANTASSCAAGSVSNCATYSGNGGTTCSVCVNGYSLANNVCTQQATITNCSIYSQSPGVCTTCSTANSFVATIVRSCQTVTTLVSNCIAYSGTAAAATCTTCATGYYLNGNVCTAFTITNCIGGTNTQCTNCAPGYVLNTGQTACIVPYTYLTDQCLQNTSVSSSTLNANTVVCSICKQGAFPINFNSYYACLTFAEVQNSNANTAVSAGNQASCLKLDSSFNCFQCDPAATNRYLQTLNNVVSCVATCNSGAYSKYVLSATSNQIVQYNVCTTNNPVANCLVYSPDLTSNTFANICTQCQPNYINVITINGTNYSNANPNATADANSVLLTSYIPSPWARYPQVTCTIATAITTIGGAAPATPTIANCDYYLSATASDFSCGRCALTFTGTLNTNNYITGCTSMNDCAATRYYNLDASINNLATCHVCNSANNVNIPVIAYVSSAANNPTFASFAKYSYAQSGAGPALTDGNGTQNVVACRPFSTAPTGVQSWSITANCGIAAIAVNTTGESSANVVGNFCVACKPGFFTSAANANATYPFVKNCSSAVANCAASSTLFNGCSTCAANFILAYANSTISFISCITVPANLSANFTNCYAATADGTGAAATCNVCKPGFSLNSDSICEALQPVNCNASGFRLNIATTSAVLNWSLFASASAVGCNRCSSGFIALNIAVDRAVCLASNYVSTVVDNLANSTYVEKCKYYISSFSTILKCSSCQTNYVLNKDATVANNDATVCLINTNLANCALATNLTTCYACTSEAFTLVNGVCAAGSIANCAAYNFTTDSPATHTAPLCTRCNADYYLNGANNTCVLGSISNCAVLNASAIRCSTCATGYFLINNSANANVADVCLPNPTTTNCGAFTLDNTGLTCTTCATPASQVSAVPVANAPTSTCVLFSQVTNCSTYNVGALNSADYTCTACATGFYLANNRCTARTTITKCVTYSPTANTCAACDATSYLAANALSCVNYPAGIFRCTTYTNATTCTACRAGFYLANNACTAVGTAIANCNTYSAATTCSACLTGYALVNNTCVQATAQNCVTYSSATACATCASGFVLSTSNGVTSCTALTKTGCATIDVNTPYNCLTCNSGYYLNNGACTAATTIARCTVYASATTCAQCDVGYSLSIDKATCITNANVLAYDDGNCSNSQVVASPSCSRCGPGYYFVNGACTGTCTTTGCLACNSNSNATCYICNTGYYQDSTGKCNALTTSTTIGTSIFGALSMLLVVIAVMFK